MAKATAADSGTSSSRFTRFGTHQPLCYSAPMPPGSLAPFSRKNVSPDAPMARQACEAWPMLLRPKRGHLALDGALDWKPQLRCSPWFADWSRDRQVAQTPKRAGVGSARNDCMLGLGSPDVQGAQQKAHRH